MSHSHRKLRMGSIDKAGCEVHHPMSDRRGVFTRRIRVTQPPADSVGGREKTLEERHGGRFLLPESVDLDSQVFGARDEFHALSGNVNVGIADREGYPGPRHFGARRTGAVGDGLGGLASALGLSADYPQPTFAGT